MRYLYLDNFRGFTKTSVPLLDVNFLVGENSTGKTSLLGLLQLLSSPRLFMGDQAGSEDWPLGHFSEMVSAHSKNQSYFRMGWAGEFRPNKESNSVGCGLLVTFQKFEGLSKITRLSCSQPNGEAAIRIEGKKVFYRFKPIDAPKNVQEAHRRVLEWAREHGSRRIGGDWKNLSASDDPNDLWRAPMFVILAYAVDPTNWASENGVNIAMPPVGPTPVWIAPIRSKPRRTYDEPPIAYSPDGTHTPYAIRRILKSKSEANKFKKFIERIGKESGLFQRIDIKSFGDTETSPFEVDAYLDDMAFGISWLGYGVSQSLPIFVELIDRPRGTWFSIQQPEVHLHPRAQAALGDAFFEMASQERKRFVVETHSDFAIDRYRINYRKKGDKSKFPKAQILFFERSDRGNKVTPIPIDQNGDLPETQPENYRQFFIREELQMLGLK